MTATNEHGRATMNKDSNNVRVIPTELPEAPFLPPVTFADRADAQRAYFALADSTRSAGDDLMAAAKDNSATPVQVALLSNKHEALNRLTGLVFQEWQRLQAEYEATRFDAQPAHD